MTLDQTTLDQTTLDQMTLDKTTLDKKRSTIFTVSQKMPLVNNRKFDRSGHPA
jgi:hypothetical protein